MQNTDSSVIMMMGQATLYVDGGDHGAIMLTWGSNPEPYSSLGAYGELRNIYATSVDTSSAQTLDIINSVIDTLYYCYVYDGTYVDVGTLTTNYDHAYINYQATGSTINTPILRADTVVGVGLSKATINNQAISYIYMDNVLNVSVYQASSTLLSVYAWYSSAYIWNIDSNVLNIFSYDSLVEVHDSSTTNQMGITVRKDNISIYNGDFRDIVGLNVSDSEVSIINTYFYAGQMGFYNTTGSLESVYMENFTTYVYWGSNLAMNNTTIQTYIDVKLSVVNASHSEIYNASFEIILLNGTFEAEYGLITNATGSVVSGIINRGNVNITGFYFIRGIALDDSTLNISNTLFDTNYNFTVVAPIVVANSSTLYCYGLNYTSKALLTISSINNSTVHVVNGNISNVISTYTTYINNSAVTNITAFYSKIYITGSGVYVAQLSFCDTNITSSTVYQVEIDSGSLEIHDSTITANIYSGDPNLLLNMTLLETNISIYDSNISSIASISTGNLYIENSTIEYVMYAYQKTHIVNSTITILLNTSLVTSGTLIVNNTRIVSGNYDNLLNITGTNNINSIMMCISTRQNLNNDTINVTVLNSDIFGVVICGGYLYMDNVDANIVMVATLDNVSIYSSTINATILSDVSMILSQPQFHVSNSTLISSNILLVSKSATFYNSTISVDKLIAVNSTFTMNLTDMNPFSNMPSIQMVSSTGNISGIDISDIVLYNSTLEISDSTVKNPLKKDSGIILSFFSRLIAKNITADNIITKPLVQYYGYQYTMMYVSATEVYTVRNVTEYILNSTIEDRYVLLYQTDNYYGTVFNRLTGAGDEYLTTNYTESNFTTADPIVLFQIDAYAKSNISQYYGKYKIRSLWVSCLTDKTPPEITPLNGSYVEYEHGIDASLCFMLNDESPTNYTLLMNNTEIMSGHYTKNFTIKLNLSDYITTPGVYVFDVYANDSDFNTAKETTTVKAYPQEPPQVTPLNATYIEYEYGERVSLYFQLSDYSPTQYVVELNGTQVDSGTYTSGQVIRVDLWTIIGQHGNYILTVKAYDKAGNVGSQDTQIVVYPQEAPIIVEHPSSTYIMEPGQTTVLNWSAIDQTPSTYMIYVNGVLSQEGSWTSGQRISYTFNATDFGTYNITIVFIDSLGQKSTHTVMISVEEKTTAKTTKTEETRGPTLGNLALIASIAIALVIVLAVLLSLLARKKKRS